MPKKTQVEKKAKRELKKIEREVKADVRELENLGENKTGFENNTPVPAAPVPEPPSEKNKEVVETEDENEDVVNANINYPVVYMRSTPKGKYRVLGILNKGDKVQILSKNEDGWTRVKTKSGPIVKGYVQSSFLQKLEG